MTLANIQHDPFIECYQAWIQEKQLSSATGADFIASFSNTSGEHITHSGMQLLQDMASLPCSRLESHRRAMLLREQV